ncbi:hypothetical protein P775_04270 [Puniceibacterium antarcticum]|uniref:Uncharacterized protein n=1 Tax=Puniceibacterium antarcticum TaxID=1206336 RepID=A0A2G8RIZ3_9RHOB|nr:hypothetical protein [Puniceibacterium antarcticum]PIL21463.1 hypothetical protein P775_04270 [Puniceibacterium antarcticum]
MQTDKRLKDFEEYLTGGYEHGVLHLLEDNVNGPEIVMFMMDVEYDPVRISFGIEGEISLHADGHTYHMFTPEQLQFIAETSVDAQEMWEDYLSNVAHL